MQIQAKPPYIHLTVAEELQLPNPCVFLELDYDSLMPSSVFPFEVVLLIS